MENEVHCNGCKTWEEEMYWKCFSTRHFCLVLSSGGAEDDYRRKIDLPRKFSENMKLKVPKKVTLQGPSGSTFSVKVKTNSKTISLADGWEAFVNSYSLKEGDILVMKYDGTPHIPVLIFSGGSHCEKESAYFFRKCGHGHAEAMTATESKKRKREGVKNNENGSDEDTESMKRKGTNDIGNGSDEEGDDIESVEEEEEEYCADDDFVDSEDEDDDDDDDCDNEDVAPFDDDLVVDDDDPVDEEGGCKTSNGDLGRHKAEKINTNNGSSEIHHQTPISNQQQKETGTSPPPAESPTVLAACVTPEAAAMSSSMGRRPSRKCVSSVSKGVEGKSAPSKQANPEVIRKRGRPPSKKKMGSTPVKKLLSATKKRKLLTPNGKLTTPAKKILALAKAQIKDDDMSFAISMKPSHVNHRFFLTLPMPWFTKHLPNRKQQVILMLDDNKWTASLCCSTKSNGSSGTVYGGWRQFALDNKLNVGDACVFNLVGTEEPAVFQVRIFRVDAVDDAPPTAASASGTAPHGVVNSNGN